MIPIKEVPSIDFLQQKFEEYNHLDLPAVEQMHIYLQCMRTANLVTRVLEDFFSKEGLSLPRYGILALLHFSYREGLTTTEIAEKKGVSKASLTPIIKWLCEQNYTEKLANSRDGRVQHIRITEEGTKKIEALVPRYVKLVKSLVGNLDKGEIDSMLGVLAKIEDGVLNYQ